METRKTLTFSKLRVGIFVLVGLAVLGFLIMNSSGDFNPFEKKMHLRAKFAAADGLREGSEVQLAGVRIGKVDEVKFLDPNDPEDFKVEAVMSIDAEMNGQPISERIRSDSIAQLVATSLLANDKVINISAGSTKGTPVDENDVLKSGVAISINQLTKTGNDLLEQINKLSIPANDILTRANRGEGTLGQILNDESLYRNLDATVSEMQSTLDKINRGRGTAGRLINDPELYNSLNRSVAQVEQITTDIRSGRGSAGKFVTDDALYNETRAAIIDLRTSAAKINTIADDFKLISTDLREGKGTFGKFLKDEQLYNDARDTLAKFNSTATRIETIISDAQAGKGTLGKLVNDETLYNNINQTASNFNQLSSESTKLIYDFRQNPKKYLRIKLSIF
ncbi:MAG TPA: MlaD family protein [Pyrinomonadaceae bacterium]|nr:MlaD family protein [Pyrinomonadaceae bacterium]